MVETLKTLVELGVASDTDKGVDYRRPSGEVRPGHNYLRHYEWILSPFRDRPITLMELGVGVEAASGRSLKLWESYLTHPDARIVGVDIGEYARRHAGGRVAIEVGDCGSDAFVSGLAAKYKPDIVLDDASHLWSHQILSFRLLFPVIKPGGIFIMEDIHTSFGSLRKSFGSQDEIDAYQYLLRYATAVVGDGQFSPATDKFQDKVPIEQSLLSAIRHFIFIPHAIIIQKK